MEGRFSILAGSRQFRLLAVAFVALLAILAAAYYSFLRTDYTILFSDLRPAEASTLVAELDRQHADYELRDGGATIAVPSDKAASIRVALAGSDLSLRGMVGFELFNESDMGLTDFAQRVNYQRALQGELARTIMMMEGIENARVHLALPERSLFRGNRSDPRAAVTVIARRGMVLDERRVAGIQRLVAAAVPGLALADVVVLDGMGRTISAAPAPEATASPEAEEHDAVESYYRARARAAIENVLPGLRFELRATAVPRDPMDSEIALGDVAANAAAPEASAAPGARNFRLRIVVLTASELDSADQSLVRNAVKGAVALDESEGDSLTLGVGPVGPLASPADLPAAARAPPAIARPAPRPAPASRLQGWWLLPAVFAIFLALLLFRPREPRLSVEDRDRLVRRIRDQLGVGSEAEDVRA